MLGQIVVWINKGLNSKTILALTNMEFATNLTNVHNVLIYSCGLVWLECLTSSCKITNVKHSFPQPAVGLVSTHSQVQFLQANWKVSSPHAYRKRDYSRKLEKGILMDVWEMWKSAFGFFWQKLLNCKKELPFSSYTIICILWTVGTTRVCDEKREREDKWRCAVPRSVAGIS